MAILPLLRRSTQAIASLVLALAVITFLFVFLAQATGRYRFVPVLSGSMSPWVDTGDVAVLEPRSADELEIGDVIAFEAPVEGTPLTLHRVVEIVSPAPDLVVRTKGDANNATDPWAAHLVDDRLWRATSHIDDLGAPVVFLNRAKTRFLWIAVAALLLGWWGMAAIWRDDDEDLEDGDDNDAAADGDDVAAGVLGPPSVPAAAGPGSRQPVPLALVVVGALVAIGAVGTRGAAATFTDRAAGSQLVSSASFESRLTLDADLVCSGLGEPTDVLLTWTPATTAVDAYVILRGTVLGGPYTAIDTVRGDILTYQDSITTLGGLPLYYLVRTLDPNVPEEESNEAFALALCDTKDILTTDASDPVGPTTPTTEVTTTVPVVEEPTEPVLSEIVPGLGWAGELP